MSLPVPKRRAKTVLGVMTAARARAFGRSAARRGFPRSANPCLLANSVNGIEWFRAFDSEHAKGCDGCDDCKRARRLPKVPRKSQKGIPKKARVPGS
jgi:hypothetical protein